MSSGPSEPDAFPGTPTWVKIAGVIVLVIVLVAIVIALFGPGEHGPGRHAPLRAALDLVR